MVGMSRQQTLCPMGPSLSLTFFLMSVAYVRVCACVRACVIACNGVCAKHTDVSIHACSKKSKR